jgi:hypothetical protein
MRRTLPISACLAALAAAPPAFAQVATVPDIDNKFAKTIQISGDQGPLVNQSIFVVPANRNFRVTDLIVSAFGAGTCLVTFTGKMTEVFVQPKTTETIHFLSGPTYGPGEQVVLGNDARLPGGSNNCGLTFTVMGYTYRAQ